MKGGLYVAKAKSSNTRRFPVPVGLPCRHPAEMGDFGSRNYCEWAQLVCSNPGRFAERWPLSVSGYLSWCSGAVPTARSEAGVKYRELFVDPRYHSRRISTFVRPSFLPAFFSFFLAFFPSFFPSSFRSPVRRTRPTAFITNDSRPRRVSIPPCLHVHSGSSSLFPS